MSDQQTETMGAAWADLYIAEPEFAIDLVHRVERGATLLDEKRPDWAEFVNLDELAMESCHDCVIGQVYGHYLDGIDQLGPTYWDLSRDGGSPIYGFDFRGDEATPQRFAALADLWRDQVRKRIGKEDE